MPNYKIRHTQPGPSDNHKSIAYSRKQNQHHCLHRQVITASHFISHFTLFGCQIETDSTTSKTLQHLSVQIRMVLEKGWHECGKTLWYDFNSANLSLIVVGNLCSKCQRNPLEAFPNTLSSSSNLYLVQALTAKLLSLLISLRVFSTWLLHQSQEGHTGSSILLLDDSNMVLHAALLPYSGSKSSCSLFLTVSVITPPLFRHTVYLCGRGQP